MVGAEAGFSAAIDAGALSIVPARSEMSRGLTLTNVPLSRSSRWVAEISTRPGSGTFTSPEPEELPGLTMTFIVVRFPAWSRAATVMTSGLGVATG
jgi:hypothetical protein